MRIHIHVENIAGNSKFHSRWDGAPLHLKLVKIRPVSRILTLCKSASDENAENAKDADFFSLFTRNIGQKGADVWKKDVWDFQVFFQTFLELRFSLGNKGKDRKKTWTPRLGLELPDVLLPDVRDHLNRGLRKSSAGKRGKSEKSENVDKKNAENTENADDWSYDDWP